jgi:tetratricopeptide (TPR) repeat protein
LNPTRLLWFGFLAVWASGQAWTGAVSPPAVSLTTGALALLYAASLSAVPDAPGASRELRAFLGIGTAIVALQLLPIPWLFPRATAWRAAHEVGPAWPGTADLFLTLRVVAQALGYVLAGLLVLRLRRGGLGSGEILQGLAAVLVLQAAFALVRFFAGIEQVPFYEGKTGSGAASGSLVSRNQFAGLMAMGLVATAALAYSRFAWKKRIAAGVGWSLAAALFATALVLSRSRGGAVAAAAGLVLLPLLHRGGTSAAAAGVVGAIAAAGVALGDPAILLERFEGLDPFALAEDSRWAIWTSTARAAMDQPLLGFGLGTHPHAYHPYQPVDLVGQIHHAHNEYVNFLFEGGFALLLLLAGGFAVWLRRSLAGAGRHAGPERFLPVAGVAAACAEAVHAFVDMDLRVTSVGLLFAALAGLGASLGRSTAPPSRRGGWILAAVSLAAAAALFLPFDAEAAGVSPFHALATFARGEAARRAGDLETADRRFATASDLWPANARLQGAAGLWFWERNDRERAAACFRRQFAQRPSDVETVLALVWRPGMEVEPLLPPGRPAAWGVYAGFLATRGRWKEAKDVFERSVPASEENAAVFDRFADRLGAASQWGLEAVVRDRRLSVKSDPGAHAAAAAAWRKLGAYGPAIDRIGKARLVDPSNAAWASMEGDLRRESGDREGALRSYMDAVALAPLDLAPVRRRALLYEELKLREQAAEDWRRVLRSLPGDAEAKAGLERVAGR